jgi:stage III sporulation protein AB
MILKLTGAALIVVSCGMTGILYSNKYINRLDSLKSLSVCIEMLRSEIVYGHIPLAQASKTIARRSSGPVADIFSDFSDLLASKQGYTASLAFEKAIDKNAARLCVNNEEMDVFKTLGKMIGISDTANQEKSLNLLSKQLDVLIDRSMTEKDKNVKMYRNLGLLGGLGLAILLL